MKEVVTKTWQSSLQKQFGEEESMQQMPLLRNCHSNSNFVQTAIISNGEGKGLIPCQETRSHMLHGMAKIKTKPYFSTHNAIIAHYLIFYVIEYQKFM